MVDWVITSLRDFDEYVVGAQRSAPSEPEVSIPVGIPSDSPEGAHFPLAAGGYRLSIEAAAAVGLTPGQATAMIAMNRIGPRTKGPAVGNVQILKGGYEAFGRGDVPSVLAIFDPRIEWREAEGNPYKPDGEPWIGGDAIVQSLFMRLATEWDGFTVTPHAYHDAGDTVVAECRYTGVYKATGKSIDAQVCHVWKFSDGKATSFQQYVDTAQMQQAMGTLDAEKTAEASLA